MGASNQGGGGSGPNPKLGQAGGGKGGGMGFPGQLPGQAANRGGFPHMGFPGMGMQPHAGPLGFFRSFMQGQNPQQFGRVGQFGQPQPTNPIPLTMPMQQQPQQPQQPQQQPQYTQNQLMGQLLGQQGQPGQQQQFGQLQQPTQQQLGQPQPNMLGVAPQTMPQDMQQQQAYAEFLRAQYAQNPQLAPMYAAGGNVAQVRPEDPRMQAMRGLQALANRMRG